MRTRVLRVFAMLLSALLLGGSLAGCGQKGDLYLPHDKQSESKRSQ